MNNEEANKVANNMTYKEALYNVFVSKGVRYRKATFIKLRELADIAIKLDNGYKLIKSDKESEGE